MKKLIDIVVSTIAVILSPVLVILGFTIVKPLEKRRKKIEAKWIKGE